MLMDFHWIYNKIVFNWCIIVISEGGGSNPEFNYKLAQVLRYGVSKNVPKNTLEKAIKDYVSEI